LQDKFIDNALSLISPLTGNLDFNDKEAVNLVLETLSADGSAVEGAVWYRTDDDTIMVHDGSNAYRVCPDQIILLPDSAFLPTSNPAALATVEGSNIIYSVLDFDKDTDESAFWRWVMPNNCDGGDVTVDIFWLSTATSGTVQWAVQTIGVTPNNSEAMDASLTAAESISDTADADASDLYQATVAAFTPNWAAGDVCYLKVYRDVSEDNAAADARLTQVVINLRP
jgi:hypothetical protein